MEALEHRPAAVQRPVMHNYALQRGSIFKARIAEHKASLSATLPQQPTTRIVTAGSVSETKTADYAKQKIEKLAGPKHGLDKSPEEKQEIAELAAELAKLGRIDNLDMTGSTWGLVFTESTASSAGKVGPFIGRTEQEFPSDQPGKYVNKLYLGPVTASLLADYKQTTRERIDVSFVNLSVTAGPFKWTKEFKNKGTWDALYIDEEIRVIRANTKNLFVLKRKRL